MSPSNTYTPEVQAALAERCSSVAVDAAFADRLVRQRDDALASEHALSAAYVRLRVKLQALDIPPGSTPEQIWAHTEARLDKVLAQLAQREAEVEQLHHINDACIELENQLRAALERAAQATAILNQSHA